MADNVGCTFTAPAGCRGNVPSLWFASVRERGRKPVKDSCCLCIPPSHLHLFLRAPSHDSWGHGQRLKPRSGNCLEGSPNGLTLWFQKLLQIALFWSHTNKGESKWKQLSSPSWLRMPAFHICQTAQGVLSGMAFHEVQSQLKKEMLFFPRLIFFPSRRKFCYFYHAP